MSSSESICYYVFRNLTFVFSYLTVLALANIHNL